MKRIKTRFITIVACFAMLLLTLALGVSALAPASRADALTYLPASLFWAMTGGEVRAYSANETDAKEGDGFGYVAFVFAEGGAKEGTVEYHRDLALKWYQPVNEKKLAQPDEPSESEPEGASVDPQSLVRKGTAVYYSMTFSFPEVNFDTFTVVFQSAEENVSKEGQAVNELVFKNDAGGLYAYLKDASLQTDEHEDYTPAEADRLAVDAAKDIAVSLSEEGCVPGEFLVKINGETLGSRSKLTNVGGYFMEYRTSGTANVPMAFKAVMPENAQKAQKVLMKELNGQTFEVTGGTAAAQAETDGTYAYEGGRVTDNAPAALVLNQKVYAFPLGQRFSLDYEAIDVCDDGVDVTRYYYMAKQENGAYVRPNLTALDESYKTLYTSDFFMPPMEGLEEEREYVSIRFTLNDGRDNATDDIYYLTWYADLDADVVYTLGEGENAFDYILVDCEKQAPHYTIIGTDDASKTNTKAENYRAVVDAYQEELNAAAENVSAGDGAYFYLPSLRSLFASDYADYRDLRFSVYYYKPGLAEGSSASSQTSLRYNNLRFEIEEPDGTYKFRIVASDANGNALQLYQDGKLVTVNADNVWDIEEIPDFSIYVGYTGAVIEDAGSQSLGYRGTSYTVSDFDIVAYGNCTRDYTLYYFDESEIKNNAPKPSYDELVNNTASFFENDDYKDCFKEINPYNDAVSEDDEAWDRTDNAYHWTPGSSTPGSFVPQKSGYYIVKLVLTDTYLANAETVAYQAIDIRNPIDITPGQIDWFRNNVTSVVLFSISAVLAVVIVVLFVVKPSDKSVEEVDLEKLKGKKHNKQ